MTQLQTELVDLCVPADATRTQRQNVLLDLKAAMLSVPCVVLERIDGEYVHDIDSRLLDAVDGDRPSLGRLGLDATGCIYAENAWRRHRLELEERAVNWEFDLDAAQSRRREAKELCNILATEIASLRTLGSSESNSTRSIMCWANPGKLTIHSISNQIQHSSLNPRPRKNGAEKV